MAVTVTPQFAGHYTKTWDIIATLDADTVATITHGMVSAPNAVSLVPLLTAAYTSQWVLTSISATEIVVTKGTGVGSGNAAAQLRVEAMLPHSITA